MAIVYSRKLFFLSSHETKELNIIHFTKNKSYLSNQNKTQTSKMTS